MDFDGTDRSQLTNDSYSDSSPVFSPDGEKIAFTSTRISGNNEVYVMPSAYNYYNSGLTNITNNVLDDVSPDWQPDRTPLDTTISSGPPTATDDDYAGFHFTGDTSRFECSLNGSAFASCTSPKEYYKEEGHHIFQVRSTNSIGMVDPTPAEWKWTVDWTEPDGSVLINGGKASTTRARVALKLSATDPDPASGVGQMRLRNSGSAWTAWQPYATSKSWKLSPGFGKKTVQVEYKDAAGNASYTASDSIKYIR